MQNISTGYQPEFGLGAYFAGQNAANIEAANQEELIKAFLENQKTQQAYQQAERINPLDVIKREQENRVGAYDAAVADAQRTNPDYIKNKISGTIGQWQSQEAAGKTALALQPMKEAAERAALENAKTKEGFQWTINDLTNKINQGGAMDENGNIVPATPAQMGFFRKQRDDLTKLLAETPDYIQKDMLKDQQYAANLEALQQRQAGELERARLLAEAKENIMKAKLENISNLTASAVRTLTDPTSTPQQRASAQAQIDLITSMATQKNAALVTPTIAMGSLDVPMNPSAASEAQARAEASLRAVHGGAGNISPDPLVAALQKAGLPYEPDKYEYRMSPEGTIQRKAKK